MRPTASSAAKAHEKTEAKSPPRPTKSTPKSPPRKVGKDHHGLHTAKAKEGPEEKAQKEMSNGSTGNSAGPKNEAKAGISESVKESKPLSETREASHEKLVEESSPEITRQADTETLVQPEPVAEHAEEPQATQGTDDHTDALPRKPVEERMEEPVKSSVRSEDESTEQKPVDLPIEKSVESREAEVGSPTEDELEVSAVKEAVPVTESAEPRVGDLTPAEQSIESSVQPTKSDGLSTENPPENSPALPAESSIVQSTETPSPSKDKSQDTASAVSEQPVP